MYDEAINAVKHGNLQKIKELLDHGIDIDAQDACGQTLLHHAVTNKQLKIVKCLLKNGTDVLITDDNSNTALHIAVANNDYNTVSDFLMNAARDNLKKLLDMKIKADGNAALHIAAKNGCYENVLFLLEFGANFEITNNIGEKPIDVANNQSIQALFELIDTIFSKAKNINEQLISDHEKCNDLEKFNDLKKYYDLKKCNDLEKCNDLVLSSLFNCRNNDGQTIMQVILKNYHYEISWNFLWLRLFTAERNFEWTYSRNRQSEMDKLAERSKQFIEFWIEHADTLQTSIDSIACYRLITGMPPPVDPNSVYTKTLKIYCEVLGNAHAVLLAYRQFAGKMSITANGIMKTVEEVLEALGFDTEQPLVNVSKEVSYYEKLPIEWKENYEAFMLLVGNMIQASIFHFSDHLNSIRLIHAVNDNDIEKVQNLLNTNVRPDMVVFKNRTILCYAAENGNAKITRLLLKAGANVVEKDMVSPVYLAAHKGYAEIVKLLLENVDTKDLAKFIDCQNVVKRTALHAAAKKGHLNIVKILLRYGATYRICDGKGRTPRDVSTNQEINDFFEIVDQCFEEAKEADVKLVYKLKAMENDDFMAIASAKNHDGHTLAMVAAMAGAKNIAAFILKMIKSAKQNEV